MTTQKERLQLLSDMIAFSIVDGQLHEKEYRLLSGIAEMLHIPQDEFKQLFHAEPKSNVVRSEFDRIQQFYRLALLMHADGVLHEKEEIAICQSAIDMGLNPAACKRLLMLMKSAENRTLNPSTILQTFKEQHN
jgi:uncharacterized tellurite resistance protein B-like protein